MDIGATRLNRKIAQLKLHGDLRIAVTEREHPQHGDLRRADGARDDECHESG